VVVYCVVLLSSVLILPHIVSGVVDLEPEQLSSLDKPQHPFLVPLTAQPILTVKYAVIATLVLQIWLARCLVKWDTYGAPQSKTTWQRSRVSGILGL
jgi:phosphatidylinositol glycan class F